MKVSKVLLSALLIHFIAFVVVSIYVGTPGDTPNPPANGQIWSAYTIPETPAAGWYKAEDIGIVGAIDYGNWIHVIVVDPPIHFDVDLPAFEYDGSYYQTSAYQYTHDRAGSGELRLVQLLLGLSLMIWVVPVGLPHKRGRQEKPHGQGLQFNSRGYPQSGRVPFFDSGL